LIREIVGVGDLVMWNHNPSSCDRHEDACAVSSPSVGDYYGKLTQKLFARKILCTFSEPGLSAGISLNPL
jgi:hypothetical protein